MNWISEKNQRGNWKKSESSNQAWKFEGIETWFSNDCLPEKKYTKNVKFTQKFVSKTKLPQVKLSNFIQV